MRMWWAGIFLFIVPLAGRLDRLPAYARACARPRVGFLVRGALLDSAELSTGCYAFEPRDLSSSAGVLGRVPRGRGGRGPAPADVRHGSADGLSAGRHGDGPGDGNRHGADPRGRAARDLWPDAAPRAGAAHDARRRS